MQYITAKEFTKVDKKIQESIMKWWKPSYGDIFSWCRPTHNLDGSPHIQYSMQVFDDDVLSFYETDNFTDTVYRHQKGDFYVPLLTVGQLIEFIEWKTNNSLEIKITCVDAKNTLLESLWEETQRICSK